MKVGFVLSGGGARGFAHAGVMQLLQEMGIKIAAIAGTSSGAVFGAYYAAGFPVNEIVRCLREVKLFSVSDFRLLKPGLFRSNGVRASLNNHLQGLKFEGLKIPLIAAATNFQSGRSEYISKGNLVEGLLASSAIPALYQPVELNEKIYVDGGLSNNLPVDPLLSTCAEIIGSHVNPLDHLDVSKLTVAAAIDRSFHIAVSSSVIERKSKCTIFLEPPGLCRYGMFQLDDAEEIFQIGYRHALRYRKQLEGCV